MTEEDPSRQPLLQLLVELYKRQPRIGYHFLYFLRVSLVYIYVYYVRLVISSVEQYDCELI